MRLDGEESDEFPSSFPLWLIAFGAFELERTEHANPDSSVLKAAVLLLAIVRLHCYGLRIGAHGSAPAGNGHGLLSSGDPEDRRLDRACECAPVGRRAWTDPVTPSLDRGFESQFAWCRVAAGGDVANTYEYGGVEHEERCPGEGGEHRGVG